MRKKLLRGGIILGIGIIILIISSLGKKKEEVASHTVKKGDITVEVKVAGTAKLMDEQQLSFGREGKIMHVYVNPGDTVSPEQVLAEIDMTSYDNNLKSAKLNLANAELGLEKLLNDDTSLRQQQLRNTISELEQNLSIEEQNYTILSQQLDSLLTQKQQSLAQQQKDLLLAQKSLSVAQKGLDIDISTIQDQTSTTINSNAQTLQTTRTNLSDTLDSFEQTVKEIDKIFGVSKTYENNNNSYDAFLSSKNSALKNKTKQYIRQSYTLIANYRQELNTLDSTKSIKEWTVFMEKIYNQSQILIDMCNIAYDAVAASIMSSPSLQQTFDGLSASISANQSKLTSQRGLIQTRRTQVESLLDDQLILGQTDTSVDQQKISVAQSQLNVEKLQDSINLLEQDIAQTKLDNSTKLQQKTSYIQTLRSNISLSKNELADVIEGADSYDIQQQQNQIQQAEVNIQNIEDQKKDYQIIADFTGRVRSVDIAEGEQYKLEDREYIVVENPDLIELELQVSQIDIVKISEGQKVIITFDAYADKEIETKITSVDVNPIQNPQGGVNYKATVLLPREGLNVYAGMTAIATIIVEEKHDVLLVPSLAVTERNGENYINILSPKPKLQKVHIGIDNNFEVEILEGLSEGQKIEAAVIDEAAFEAMGIDDSSSSIF